MWPYDYLKYYMEIDLHCGPPFPEYTPQQINRFVRTETRKTDAILARGGIELSRLMKLHPLGEYDDDGDGIDAVRKSIYPGELDHFCRFMVDRGAWLTPDCWEDYAINIGPDPDYWMLCDYLAEKPGTLLEQYRRLKYLSNTARVMDEWQDTCNTFDNELDAAWLARARASRWVGADANVEDDDAPGILLVCIYDKTRKAFPLYAKACEEALFDVHDGEDMLYSLLPEGDSPESMYKSIMDAEDLAVAPDGGDHPLTRAWRLRLRMAALRAKRLHELTFTLLAMVKWYPKLKAWMMHAREKAHAPGGAGAKRSRESFDHGLEAMVAKAGK